MFSVFITTTLRNQLLFLQQNAHNINTFVSNTETTRAAQTFARKCIDVLKVQAGNVY